MKLSDNQVNLKTLYRRTISLLLSFAISLGAIISMFAVGADSAYAASSSRRFSIYNASNDAASVSIHSRTKANPTWTPNLANPDEATAKKIAKATGKALVAGSGAVTAATGGTAAPIAATTAGVGAVITVTADPALSAIYDIYDSRLAARTVAIPAKTTASKTISVLPPYRWKRSYFLRAVCPGGRIDDKEFGYTKSESFSATVCQ